MKKICLSFVLVAIVGAVKLPPQLQTCHLSDKDLDHCISVALEEAIQKNPKGFPELGIPSLDPVEIAEMTIGAGSGGAVNFEQIYKDVNLLGFSSVKIKKAHLDFQNKLLTFTTFVPDYLLKGHYNFNGTILVLPVHGDGQFATKLLNGTWEHTIEFEEIQKNEETFFKIKKYDLKVVFMGIIYRYENLFDGNKLLSDNIHTVVNDNWDTVFEDVRSGYEQIFAEVFKNYASKIFDKIPIKDIFPK